MKSFLSISDDENQIEVFIFFGLSVVCHTITILNMSAISKIVAFSKKYPVTRGIAAYAIIWPVGSLVQQTFAGEEKYDYGKVGRFCLYGSCYVAPTLYCWIKIATRIWPLNNLRSALTKAIVEQFTYTPFAMVSFYFGMTLLEGKTIEDGKNEVIVKFLPTYQVGALVWPVLQTFNYTVVKERNRVVFVSICSLIWTSFLAYMKHLEQDEVLKPKPNKTEAEGTSTNSPVNKTVHHLPSETKTEKGWVIGRQLDR